MKFRSLYRKSADETKYILAQPTMIFTQNRANVVYREHVVREDEVTRPDLIALEYYGGEDHVDYLLKWNGISDPFSLQPGDVLEIPPAGLPISTLERPAAFEDNPIKNQFIQGKRLQEKDKRRLDALKKKYNKETLLPPNVIPVGKKNYKFDKEGNIIFGAQAQNADVNPANLSQPTVDPVVDEVLNDIAGGGVGITSGSGSGSGFGGGAGLTQTQLEKLLNENVGKGKTSSGSGGGRGTSATESATNAGSGDAPESTNNADGVSNDGAPCN